MRRFTYVFLHITNRRPQHVLSHPCLGHVKNNIISCTLGQKVHRYFTAANSRYLYYCYLFIEQRSKVCLLTSITYIYTIGIAEFGKYKKIAVKEFLKFTNQRNRPYFLWEFFVRSLSFYCKQFLFFISLLRRTVYRIYTNSQRIYIVWFYIYI